VSTENDELKSKMKKIELNFENLKKKNMKINDMLISEKVKNDDHIKKEIYYRKFIDNLNNIIHAKNSNANDNNKHLDYIYDNNENKNKKMFDYSPEISEELMNLYLESQKNDTKNHENVVNTVNYLCNDNLDDDNDNDDDDNGDDNGMLAINDSEHYNNTTVHYDGNKYYYRNNNINHDNDNDSDDDNKSEYKYGK
jgi:hypothetical protein